MLLAQGVHSPNALRRPPTTTKTAKDQPPRKGIRKSKKHPRTYSTFPGPDPPHLPKSCGAPACSYRPRGARWQALPSRSRSAPKMTRRDDDKCTMTRVGEFSASLEWGSGPVVEGAYWLTGGMEAVMQVGKGTE